MMISFYSLCLLISFYMEWVEIFLVKDVVKPWIKLHPTS
jgi:hypothetical protein